MRVAAEELLALAELARRRRDRRRGSSCWRSLSAELGSAPCSNTSTRRRSPCAARSDGKPLRPEAGLWRRVLLLFARDNPPPALLIVAHDTDGDRARSSDLEQALALTDPFPVIVAIPHQDAEAWFVAGFRPAGDAERRRLDGRKDALGFDPPEEPHRLTAHPNAAHTDAKRVLRILVFNENESRPPSLEELPDLCDRTLNDLGLLERRGGDCGLAAFLGALRSTLVPLFIPGPAGR